MVSGSLVPRKRHEQPKFCRVKGHNITIARAATKPGDEASFRSVHYLEVKIRCKNALGPRIVSAVRSLEVVTSRRLPMYCK